MKNFLLGDARFFWQETLNTFPLLPSSWDSSLNTGLGMPAVNTLWITGYLHLTIWLGKIFQIDWFFANILFWIIPSIFLSFFSAFVLFGLLFPRKKFYGILSGMIYATNTYFIMIFLGGQQGVALAYSIAPFVIWSFLKYYNKTSLSNTLILSILIAVQILFDPRLFFLAILMLLLYLIVFFDLKNIKNVLKYFPIAVLIVFLMHSFWTIPLLFYKFSSSVSPVEISDAVKFFSFAKFEDTISLLHPNFPENIFGKVYFLKPEFLILPIIAFMPLFFLKKENYRIKKTVIYLVILSLIGAFIAKGTNEPFGYFYNYLFENVPGFSLFRDPTKFYVFVTLGYSLLIPFSFILLVERLKKKNRMASIIAFLAFVVFWLFLMRHIQAYPLHTVEVPKSYIDLKNYLVSQGEYFRTLWIPQWHRYGYFSDDNPAIGRYEYLKSKNPLGMVGELSTDTALKRLQEYSIKYIIVPEDLNGEIFIKDRKYDNDLYKKTILELSKNPAFTKVISFGKIVVFEVDKPMEHFYSENEDISIKVRKDSPTSYLLNISNANIGDMLIFSESFDRNWKLKSANLKLVESQNFKSFNSFELPEKGTYSLQVFYQPQEIVKIGIYISIVTMITVLVFLFYLRRKSHN